MNLALVVKLEELDRLARQLVPLEVDLSSVEHGRRVISVHRVSRVELVPEVGIRLWLGVDVDFTMFGFTVPVKVDDLSLLIRLTTDGHKLDFRFEIERADVRHVPELVEGALARRLNDALAEEASVPSFRFGELAERKIELPEWLGPLRDLVLGESGGYLAIEHQTLTFLVGLSVRAQGRPSAPAPTLEA